MAKYFRNDLGEYGPVITALIIAAVHIYIFLLYVRDVIRKALVNLAFRHYRSPFVRTMAPFIIIIALFVVVIGGTCLICSLFFSGNPPRRV